MRSRKERIKGRKRRIGRMEEPSGTFSVHIHLRHGWGLLREAGTIHAPARQHSSGLKRSGVTQRPHPANQTQGTNSLPLFLVYVFALVERTQHFALHCPICSLIDCTGMECLDFLLKFMLHISQSFLAQPLTDSLDYTWNKAHEQSCLSQLLTASS